MNPLVVIFIVIAVAGIIFLLVKAAQAHAERERQRKAGLAHWASVSGFTYSEKDPWNLAARYNGIAEIGRGHDRYALEVLTRQDPVPTALFRYHFKTWETRTVRDSKGRMRTKRYQETHWRRYLVVEVGAQFPHLALRQEGLFDKMAGFMGFDDIDFESEEFSKRYHVKSADKQFAYAVIHPQMMEWMLAEPFAGELVKGRLVMDVNSRPHSAEGCQEAWRQACGFVNRIPEFVWQDYGHRAPVTLPEPAAYASPPPALAGVAGPGHAASGMERTH